jgi:AraC-like DNA-binding protein
MAKLVNRKGGRMMPEQLPKSLQTFVEPFHFRIFTDENEGDWKMPFEWHEQLEIFYALEGRGKYFIEDRSYTFEKGDLFVIGNHELHKSQLIEGESFKAMIIMFNPNLATAVDIEDQLDPLTLFYDRPADFSHQLKISSELDDKLKFIFKAMMLEYERTEGYSPRGVVSLLQWVLVELYRAYFNNKQVNDVESFKGLKLKKVVTRVLDYIDEHFTEDINLVDVAQKLNVSPSYLSREFKSSTGFSLIEFISSKRIRYARELLRNTSISVTEIASKAGYNNVTHFHWTFKKMIGISPGQYRKMSKVYSR